MHQFWISDCSKVTQLTHTDARVDWIVGWWLLSHSAA